VSTSISGRRRISRDSAIWTAVRPYLDDLLVGSDAALDPRWQGQRRGGAAPISGGAHPGKLLHLLARIRGARAILEIGTLGAYSTIWMARALPPDGRLITLEIDPRHAKFARANLGAGRAGPAGRGPPGPGARPRQTGAEGAGPFDLIFIDADKANIPAYFKWALQTGRARASPDRGRQRGARGGRDPGRQP